MAAEWLLLWETPTKIVGAGAFPPLPCTTVFPTARIIASRPTTESSSRIGDVANFPSLRQGEGKFEASLFYQRYRHPLILVDVMSLPMRPSFQARLTSNPSSASDYLDTELRAPTFASGRPERQNPTD